MEAIWGIAQATYREALRSKVLVLVLAFLIVLLGFSTLMSSAMLGENERVVLDLSFFGISLFCAAYASLAGSLLLAKELGKRTIYNILSRAISRDAFLIGKWLGLSITLFILLFLMSISSWIFLTLVSGKINLLFWQGVLLIASEVLIISAVSIFFSSLVVTPVLAGLFTAGLFLAGRSSEQILSLGKYLGEDGISQSLLRVLYAALPHLDDLGNTAPLVYGESLPWSSLFAALVYGLSFAAIFLGLAILIFRRREFP